MSDVDFCKGFEFRFRSGARIGLGLGDMSNVVPFTQAVCAAWKSLPASACKIEAANG
jgi:hypothetical protein